MAEYDYSDDVQFAIESVDEFGRAVQFVTVGSETDAQNPLGRPTDAPQPSAPVKAAFVVLTGENSLGISKRAVDLLKQSEQTCLLAPSAVNYETQTHMIDSDGSRWKIDTVQKLMPGNTPVLYYMGVSR